MTISLMRKLFDVAYYVCEELTDELVDEYDLGRRFWNFFRSKTLNDSVRKIRVSDYVKGEIMKIDCAEFNRKYSVRLDLVKKSKEQLTFVCKTVTLMFQFSDAGQKILDWS